MHLEKSKQFNAGILLGLLAGAFPTLVSIKLLYEAPWPDFFAGNLLANGVSCIVLTWFGIRFAQKWAWFLFAFILIFVGINDLLLIPKNHFPLPIVPLTLGCLCLLLTYSKIFKKP